MARLAGDRDLQQSLCFFLFFFLAGLWHNGRGNKTTASGLPASL